MFKKNMLLAASLVVLCLTGCSDNSNKVDGILEGYEERQDIGISNDGDNVNYKACVQYCGESTQGFYYYDGKQLHFMNKQSGNTIYLCTKVQCEHIFYEDDDYGLLNTCDAILDASNCVQVYNGNLYIDVENGMAVQAMYKMNLDGTGREVVVENISERFAQRLKELEEIGTAEIAALGGTLSWEIYKDKLYVCSCIGGEKDKLQFYVDVYSLENGERTDELVACEFEGNSGMIIDIDIFNDTLKVCMYISSWDSNGNILDGKEFYSIDINNGVLKEIADDAIISTYAFCENEMLYREKGGDIYEIGIDENAKKCIELTDVERESTVAISYVGDYIYITPNIKDQNVLAECGYYTKVYDKEYKLIDTIVLPEKMTPIAGHEQVLLNVVGADEMYYFDISQIGTGNVDVEKYTMD